MATEVAVAVVAEAEAVAAAAVAVARVAAEEGITGKHDSTTVEGGREEGKRKRMEKKMEQGFLKKQKQVEVVVVVGNERTNQDILEVQRCRDELYDSDGEELMGRRRMETTDGDDG